MSLVPARYNLTVYQGATFYQRITFSVDGAIQDVTGYDVSLEVKTRPDGTELITLDTDTHGGVSLGGTAGTIDFFIPASTTETFTWTTGFYELFVTDLSPRTDVLLFGGFKVIPF